MPGVEESSTVEASLQVPTSSSAAKLSSEASDNKPGISVIAFALFFI